MAELELLNKKLDNIKRTVNRSLLKLKESNEFTNYDLKIRLKVLADKRGEFDDTIAKIEIISPETNFDRVKDEFEDQQHEAHVIINRLLDRKENIPSLSQTSVRLPELQLPSFTGNYEEWYTFKDTFTSLIGNNAALTDVQKYIYLNSCLKGQAAQLLGSLAVNDENYVIAWKLLADRFENKTLILQAHIDAILDHTDMIKESAPALRRLIDDISKHCAALKTMNQPVESWGSLLTRIISRKLDPSTRQAWERESNKTKSLPTYEELIDFLNIRCRILETTSDKRNNKADRRTVVNVSATAGGTYQTKCANCGGHHTIYSCAAFKSLSVFERKIKAQQLKLCLNCLKGNHIARDCRGNKCNICGRSHNRLLHFNNENTRREEIEQPADVIATSAHANVTSNVLLTTALIKIVNNGRTVSLRALLDGGSDSNFMTKSAFGKLKIKSEKTAVRISGIAMAESKTCEQADVEIQSSSGSYKRKLKFLLLDAITSRIPTIKLDTRTLNIPQHIRLADPTYDTPGEIDVLLGAGVFYELLKPERMQLGPKKPTLQNSVLGWLVTGSVESNYCERRQGSCNLSITKAKDNLDELIMKFWKIEQVREIDDINWGDHECELNFKQNVTRTENGRFVVHLPLKDDTVLGNSKKLAVERFYALENRLIKNSEIKISYVNFMREYLELNHMKAVSVCDKDSEEVGSNKLIYYIPHHHVIKTSSTTTKLRVVFNASAKTSNGKSLNDILRVGPSIQSDLFEIMLRFRTYPIVVVGDIEKMYRQVLVHDTFTDLQRIIWRENPEEPLMIYKLNTVTYGTAPASFLATRCLKQLAVENRDMFPEASRTIERDFYMDDWIAGGDTVEAVVRLKDQVVNILNSAGFKLRKFGSNHGAVIRNYDNIINNQHLLKNYSDEKMLGIHWDAETDTIRYEFKNENTTKITKRNVISAIAKVFDPLGLLAPVLVSAKIFMQKLWRSKFDWDDELSEELKNEWLSWQSDLNKRQQISIPRHVLLTNHKRLEIHGFCDASERAFGAVVYAKTIDESGNVKIGLLGAKSKVAPLKQVTLPRLELCGAVLLTNLINQISTAVNLLNDDVHLWTDSTIVLNWINNEPSRLKTFVANRIAKIQTKTERFQWHHVPGVQNPADIVSRGAKLEGLITSDWFTGPEWLAKHDGSYKPITVITDNDDIELKTFTVTTKLKQEFEMFERFTSYTKLIRTVAWCKRFAHNCRNKNKIVGRLQNNELRTALYELVKIAQTECFNNELKLLQGERGLQRGNKLIKLNCFVDEDRIIRVGGRLKRANIAYDTKHPIILPKNHKLTWLIIECEHKRLLHAGSQLTLASLRERFWPIGGRMLVKGIIRKCIRCFKANPISHPPLMGDLPMERVNQMRPFRVIGIDYCGPFLLKNSQVRNRVFIKAYVCVIVCFATKAVHLELTTSLSTEAFMNVLKRFIGRRSLPSKIISDNGKNFVGAWNEIQDVKKSLNSLNHSEELHSYLSNNNVEWSFIPARSPHFGGLHEAAVKSVKSHLKRVLGNAKLSYESLYTILCQIEGVLNSRPLIPLSEDPTDLEVLTPGHFLVNQPLTTLPERITDEDIQPAKLSDYQRQQLLVLHIRKRWQRDYLHLLQERVKWNKSTSNVKEGALVLMKENNVPPLQWRMARIVKLHPGADGVVRVVTLRTTTGTTTRAVTCICPLPSNF